MNFKNLIFITLVITSYNLHGMLTQKSGKIRCGICDISEPEAGRSLYEKWPSQISKFAHKECYSLIEPLERQTMLLVSFATVHIEDNNLKELIKTKVQRLIRTTVQKQVSIRLHSRAADRRNLKEYVTNTDDQGKENLKAIFNYEGVSTLFNYLREEGILQQPKKEALAL